MALGRCRRRPLERTQWRLSQQSPDWLQCTHALNTQPLNGPKTLLVKVVSIHYNRAKDANEVLKDLILQTRNS